MQYIRTDSFQPACASLPSHSICKHFNVSCHQLISLCNVGRCCRPDRWCAARSVVSGRLINGYSVNDWTLGLLYRVHR